MGFREGQSQYSNTNLEANMIISYGECIKGKEFSESWKLFAFSEKRDWLEPDARVPQSPTWNPAHGEKSWGSCAVSSLCFSISLSLVFCVILWKLPGQDFHRLPLWVVALLCRCLRWDVLIPLCCPVSPCGSQAQDLNVPATPAQGPCVPICKLRK